LAKQHPTLWRALPAIEELQTAWENKSKKASFVKYHNAIASSLKKIVKYYSHFNEKLAYGTGLGTLYPHFPIIIT
jgi:beta-glucosidase/6-phospho-beta-glucosidase/beta-galactosidase